jgi:hypothetical protein
LFDNRKLETSIHSLGMTNDKRTNEKTS